MKYFVILLFVAMCLAQWFVPGKMIYDSEHVIAEGTVFKFKTAPVDPSDPFRGKYITLNFDANFISDTSVWQSGELCHVTFSIDSAGFATAESISRTAPEEGSYLTTKISYASSDPPKVHYNLPFDRFYLEESKASEAEQTYWEAQRDSTQTAYALVSIGRGQAVLTDVIVNGKSVTSIVEEINEDNDE